MKRSVSACKMISVDNLNNLHSSLLQRILFYCDENDIAKCAQVSQIFRVAALNVADYLITFLTNTYYPCLLKYDYWQSLHSSKFAALMELCKSRIIVVRGFVVYSLNANTWLWKRCSDCRRDRSHFSSISYKGEFYAIGTFSMVAAGTVEKYNPFINKWMNVASLPRKLRSVTSVVFGQYLFVIGGIGTLDEVVTDEILVFRDDGEENYKDIVAHGTQFLLMAPPQKLLGGVDVKKTLSEVDLTKLSQVNDAPPPLSNAREQRWEVISTKLLFPRYRHAATIYKGKVWIAGGCHDNHLVTNSVEIFDPVAQTVEEGPPMLVRRDFAHLFVLFNVLYAVGGDVDQHGHNTTRTIEKYDEEKKEWVHVTVFKTDRIGFAPTMFGSMIYIFGGESQSHREGESDSWDAFDVLTGQWVSDSGLMKNVGSMSSTGQSSNAIRSYDSNGQAVDKLSASLSSDTSSLVANAVQTKGFEISNMKMPMIDAWGQASVVPPAPIHW